MDKSENLSPPLFKTCTEAPETPGRYACPSPSVHWQPSVIVQRLKREIIGFFSRSKWLPEKKMWSPNFISSRPRLMTIFALERLSQHKNSPFSPWIYNASNEKA